MTTVRLEVEALPPRDDRVLTLPENVSATTGEPSEEAREIVAAMNERILMEQGYREMADEMLSIARDARAAQIRALSNEE